MVQQPRDAEAEIAKLALSYAFGTDAIGCGDLQKGRELYRACFTPEAVIAVFLPRTANDFTGPPDAMKTGPDEWAELVASAFKGKYTATQHLIGNVDIHVHGNTATMTSYLHATHKRSDTSIDVANGTYEDEVVLRDGQWRIRRRTLKLITFLTLAASARS